MTRRQFGLLNLTALATAAPPASSVTVGPDSPVGGQRNIQIEPYIAANPKNPNNLIVCGAALIDGHFQARAHSSGEAGKSWSTSVLKVPQGTSYSVNTWVTFGDDGTAYYVATCQPAKAESFLVVYRSSDEGRTWSDPVQIPGTSYDQPRMIAGAGITYVATNFRGVAVHRSRDSGATFELASQIPITNLGNQPRNPILLTNGSLLIPYCDFPLRADQRLNASRIYCVRSDDKGTTFGIPRFVAEVPRAFLGGGGEFATDLSAGPYSSRIYAAWEDGDFGPRIIAWSPDLRREVSGTRRELVISYSNDQGRVWSVPKPVAPSAAGPAFMGSIAVSPQGVLGALWIQHERYETNPQDYRVWFAASLDGGETFTQPTPVSSDISRPDRSILSNIDYIRTRPRGGDYIGLTASADSTFHAVWADARSGVFQTFHSAVKVKR